MARRFFQNLVVLVPVLFLVLAAGCNKDDSPKAEGKDTSSIQKKHSLQPKKQEGSKVDKSESRDKGFTGAE
jgi:hypothetical protein